MTDPIAAEEQIQREARDTEWHRREDQCTNYPEDAAHYERWRGQSYDTTDDTWRPTRAELEAEDRR